MKRAGLNNAARAADWIRRQEARPNRAQLHAAHLHAPDPHDAHVYASAYETAREWPPELALRWAVLEQALAEAGKCVRDSDPARYERQRLCDWFTSSQSDWPFSFAALCEALGLDEAAVRMRALVLLAGAGQRIAVHTADRVLDWLREHGRPATVRETAAALRIQEAEASWTLVGLAHRKIKLVERVGPARYRAVREG